MDIFQFKDELNYKNDDELINGLTSFYSFKGYKPTINIEGNVVRIHIDTHILDETEKSFNRANDLCNQGRYKEAIPVLQEVVGLCPLHADAFRSLAQAYFMLGDLESALDTNIETLKIDAANAWGLVLMGNILAKKGDSDAAMGYYKKVLQYHPDNGLAMNNVGAALMEQQKFDEAIEVFKKCLVNNKTFVNSYYGMGLAYQKLGKLEDAWDILYQGAIASSDRKENPGMRDHLLKLYISVSQELCEEKNNFMGVLDLMQEKLKKDHDGTVQIKEDPTLSVYAKLEYGPTYNRNYHVIKYNRGRNGKNVEHYIMHEFMHLFMALEANKKGKNILVASTRKNENDFIRRFKKYFDTLSARIGHDKVTELEQKLFNGLVLQLMNGPLDLLVEDRLFRKYPEIRPLQLLSLLAQERDNVNAVTGAMDKPGMFPNAVVHTSKILNMVTSMHLKDLYCVDFVSSYRPTKAEYNEAKDLYEEYLAYRDNYKPGEEYDMMMYFIEHFDFEELINAIPEQEYTQKHNAAQSFSVGANESNMQKTQEFNEQHKDGKDATETFMMSMYMIGAMQYFENMPIDDIRKVAYEIAMIGCGGIDPSKKNGYTVTSIPDKDFGGYQLLAYYYVSWAIAIPDMLDSLQLPFKTAYESAKSMYELKKRNNGK